MKKFVFLMLALMTFTTFSKAVTSAHASNFLVRAVVAYSEYEEIGLTY